MSTAADQDRFRPVLVLELNELCPPILERMMAAGELPHFSALHEQSAVYLTHTDDESLEPWVQWVSFHTGVPQTLHGASELDEGHLIDRPRTWDLLAQKGLSSLVFGSLNAATRHPDQVFVLPDAWSVGVKATDPSFQGLHDFLHSQVTEHANPEAKAGLAALARAGRFLIANGLTAATALAAVRQIASERLQRTDGRWRRAIILDRLMWDVFARTWRRRQPHFATFFANSTAFLQHRYWRHMQPEAYVVKPDAWEMASYGGAIEESYREMDALVGRARRLVGPDGRLVLVTALSQEANTRYEAIGGKFVYRARRFEELFDLAGCPRAKGFEPVMTHQAWASYETAEEAEAAARALGRLTLDGEPFIESKLEGPRILFWSGRISKVNDDAVLAHPDTGARAAHGALFFSLGQVNNSQHNRLGCLWLPAGEDGAKVHCEPLALERGAALLLALLGIETPDLAAGRKAVMAPN